MNDLNRIKGRKITTVVNAARYTTYNAVVNKNGNDRNV